MRHLHKRLDELHDLAIYRLESRQKAVRPGGCVVDDWMELVKLVISCVAFDDAEILGDVFRQFDEFTLRSKPGADGNKPVHGFAYWMFGLKQGWWPLPGRLPTSFLLAWKRGYLCGDANRPPRSPQPAYRCEDCKLVLPDCQVDGSPGRMAACPACSGTKIAAAVAGQPPGTFSLDDRHRPVK
jgi:hypothetical protein